MKPLKGLEGRAPAAASVLYLTMDKMILTQAARETIMRRDDGFEAITLSGGD